MDRAIKGLAWYTVVLLIISTVLIVHYICYIGEPIVLTPTIMLVSVTLNSPIVVLAILVLVRMRRRDSLKLS